MAKTVIPGVPHIPKTPRVGYLGEVLPSGHAPAPRIKQTVARISPLKRSFVQVPKTKPGKSI